MKTLIFVSMLTSLFITNDVLAFGLGDVLKQVEGTLKPLNNPIENSKKNTARSEVAPAQAKPTKNTTSKFDDDYDKFLAESKRKAEEDRKKDELYKIEQKKRSAEQERIQKEERKQREAEDERKRREGEEETRLWQEAQEKRIADNERKREVEHQKQVKRLARKAERKGNRRGVIAAPFDQKWGAESFSSSKKQNVTKSHNVETFSYQFENTPSGTADIAFLVCDGSGLQKITWLSTKQNAWTIGPRFKELKAILADKYGSPSEEFGLSRVYWPGASGTDVVLITNKYSNQNMKIVIHYGGPKLGACLSKLEKSGKAGF